MGVETKEKMKEFLRHAPDGKNPPYSASEMADAMVETEEIRDGIRDL